MSITIILNNYHNVCFPGQTISGRIECDFNDEEKLRAIRIHFHGSAKTKWSESKGSGKSRRTVYYSAEENYFDEAYNLLEGGEDFTLPAGKHVYPFSYILPAQLPSSCDLAYGHIHYKIIGTVDRPWRFDYETEFYLNVASPLDLNYLSDLRERRALSTDKEVGCWCCKSGPVNLEVSLPITGFVPGQDVNVGCYIKNLSNVSISEVRFKINVLFEFIAHSPSTKSRHSDDRICKYVEGGVGAHGEKSWTATFTVPMVPFVNLMHCGIINVGYILEVEAVLPCPHTNLGVELPIVIGSIPLMGVSTSLPGPPIAEHPLPQYPAVHPMPLPATAPLMPQPNMPYPPEGMQGFPNKSNELPTYNDVIMDKV